ncbi:hypothetical protein JST97_25840 [bacterium]|nr:hypothetical protein [bacterium]
MGSPFAEHPFRVHRLPGQILRWLWLGLLLLLYHHFHASGILTDQQWRSLNIDGVPLGNPTSRRSIYLHLDRQGRVHYISGRELRLDGRVLLRIGDEITAAREILGHPQILSDTSGTYYFYRRGHLSVGCAVGPNQRIAQICLQKNEKKPVKH